MSPTGCTVALLPALGGVTCVRGFPCPTLEPIKPASRRRASCGFGPKSEMAKTIYVLNGPNLNMLGQREPEKYGRISLAEVERLCRERARRHGFEIVFRQSNHEGEIIDALHEARREGAAAVILNPAGYGHTSIALLDAVIAADLPTFEVHITNIHARESYRRHSFVSAAARAVLCGFGIEGYGLAIDGAAALLGETAKA